MKFEGIGTHWYINIYDDISTSRFEIIKNKISTLVVNFENNYSRFIDSSLISILNKDKKLTEVSDELIEIIDLANKAKEVTSGHFDITVGSVLEGMGYDSKYSFESKEINFNDSRNIDINGRVITLGKNTMIDIGGIGKGYLIDKVKQLIITNGIKYFFINAGGDIYATSNYDKSIEFALENPFNLKEMIGKISIKNMSIASSSNSRRSWYTKNTNQKYAHLIDMETKKTVTYVSGVYTYANTSVNSDISSTCFFVSPKELDDKISKQYLSEYLIVYSDKTIKKSSNYPATIFLT
ncbi:MAG: FAD:protein FMN transferase [bacterium]